MDIRSLFTEKFCYRMSSVRFKCPPSIQRKPEAATTKITSVKDGGNCICCTCKDKYSSANFSEKTCSSYTTATEDDCSCKCSCSESLSGKLPECNCQTCLCPICPNKPAVDMKIPMGDSNLVENDRSCNCEKCTCVVCPLRKMVQIAENECPCEPCHDPNIFKGTGDKTTTTDLVMTTRMLCDCIECSCKSCQDFKQGKTQGNQKEDAGVNSNQKPPSELCECACDCDPCKHKDQTNESKTQQKDPKQENLKKILPCNCLESTNPEKLKQEQPQQVETLIKADCSCVFCSDPKSLKPKILKKPMPCNCFECVCNPCADNEKRKLMEELQPKTAEATGESKVQGAGEAKVTCSNDDCTCEPCPDTSKQAEKDQEARKATVTCSNDDCMCEPCPDISKQAKKDRGAGESTNTCSNDDCTCDPCPDTSKQVKKVQGAREATSTCSNDDCTCDPCPDTSKRTKKGEGVGKATVTCSNDECICDPCPDPFKQGKMNQGQGEVTVTCSNEDCTCDLCPDPSKQAEKLQKQKNEEKKDQCTGETVVTLEKEVQENQVITCDCPTCSCNPCNDKTKGQDPNVKKSDECICIECSCEDPKKKQDSDADQAKGNVCICPTCICEPCPDPNIQNQKEQQKNNLGDDQNVQKETFNCTCSICSCDRCPDPKLQAKNKDKEICRGENELRQIPSCDCPICNCDPCNDPNVKHKKGDTNACNCPTCSCTDYPDPNIQSKENSGDQNQQFNACDCPECKCNPCNDPNINQNKGDPNVAACNCNPCSCDDCPDPNIKSRRDKGKCPVESKCIESKKSKQGPTQQACDCPVCNCNPCMDPSVKKEKLGGDEKQICPVISKCIQSKQKSKGGYILPRPCDCSDCDCNPCNDPNVQNTKGPSVERKGSPINCQCVTCKCEPCPDSDAQSKNQGQGTAKCKCAGGEQQEVKSSSPCDCPACTCSPCQDPNFKGKNQIEELPTNDDESCDCIECICNPCKREQSQDKKGSTSEHYCTIEPSAFCGSPEDGTIDCNIYNCYCTECQCDDEYDIEEEEENEESKCPCKTCTCIDNCDNDNAIDKEAKSECQCLECRCNKCGFKKDTANRSSHDRECICVECICEKLTQNSLEFSKCHCTHCTCEDCVSKKVESTKDNPTNQKCDYKCIKCECPDSNQDKKTKESCICAECICPKCSCSDCMCYLDEKKVSEICVCQRNKKGKEDATANKQLVCSCPMCSCIDCQLNKNLGGKTRENQICTCSPCNCISCIKKNDSEVQNKGDQYAAVPFEFKCTCVELPKDCSANIKQKNKLVELTKQDVGKKNNYLSYACHDIIHKPNFHQTLEVPERLSKSSRRKCKEYTNNELGTYMPTRLVSPTKKLCKKNMYIGGQNLKNRVPQMKLPANSEQLLPLSKTVKAPNKLKHHKPEKPFDNFDKNKFFINEKCKYKEQIKVIKKAIKKIKFNRENNHGHLNNQAKHNKTINLTETMSQIEIALNYLKQNVKIEDSIIRTMTKELKQCTSSLTLVNLFSKSDKNETITDNSDDTQCSHLHYKPLRGSVPIIPTLKPKPHHIRPATAVPTQTCYCSLCTGPNPDIFSPSTDAVNIKESTLIKAINYEHSSSPSATNKSISDIRKSFTSNRPCTKGNLDCPLHQTPSRKYVVNYSEKYDKALNPRSSYYTSTAPRAVRPPLVKQASSFNETISDLRFAVTSLQAKCKAKDKIIEKATRRLKKYKSSGVLCGIFNSSFTEAPDYDQTDDIKLKKPIKNIETRNTKRAIEEKEKMPKKEKLQQRNEETNNKEEIKETELCKCGKYHKEKYVNLNGFRVINIRRITTNSITVEWKAPKTKVITGYEIEINEELKSKVLSGWRTCAMIHSVDLSSVLNISIFAVTACGRVGSPARAIYEIKRNRS